MTATRRKILVVDDSTAFLTLLSSVLPRAGFEVTPLSDPALVFFRIMRLKPDLLLLDVNMPGLDGPTVVRKLKRVESLASLPVVLCSGDEQANLEQTAHDCGADGAVSKMLGAHEIVSRLKDFAT